MTVEEALSLSKTLAGNIQALVQAYETETGCFVHSIPLGQRCATTPITVDVKVQITPPRS